MVCKRLLNILAGISLTLAASSCSSYYSTVLIENERPPKKELPAGINSLTIMNRSMTPRFSNEPADSIQRYFYRHGFQLSKVINDSLASDTTIKALAQVVFESGRFETVVPVERNFWRDTLWEVIQPIDPDVVDSICSNYNTDALLVMENFTTKVMTDYSSDYVYTDFSATPVKAHYASIDVRYEALFRVYAPGMSQPVSEIKLADTLYWDNSDFTQVDLFRHLPSVKQAVINAGIKVALDLDDLISPTWDQEKRGYFLFQKKDDPGKIAVLENNWPKAETYWTTFARSANAKTRSKAEYNLALAAEMNGDIESAIKWAVKSYYSYYRVQTENYLLKLKSKRDALNEQKSDKK